MTGENWLSGFNYRKSHLITGHDPADPNDPYAGTDFQVAIKVYKGSGTDGTESISYFTTAGKIYCANHCKDDFGDIRFTSSDGSTEIDYWLEDYSSGSWAIFWLEIPDSLNSGETSTIYSYYGSDSASTTSNGVNTFCFFDDFDTLDGWTIHSGTWTAENSSAKCTSTGYIKRIYNPPTGKFPKPCKFGFKAKLGRDTQEYDRVMFIYRCNTSLTYGYRAVLITRTDLGGKGIEIDVWWYAGGYYVGAFELKSWSTGVWYKLDGHFTYDYETYLEFNRDGGPVAHADPLAIEAYGGIYIGFELRCDAEHPSYIDYVFVRKHADPEPTHTSWGEEEGIEAVNKIEDLEIDIIRWYETQRCNVTVRDIPTSSSGSTIDAGTHVLKNRIIKMTIRLTDSQKTDLQTIFEGSSMVTITTQRENGGGTWTYTAWFRKRPVFYQYSKKASDNIREWCVDCEFVCTTFSFS